MNVIVTGFGERCNYVKVGKMFVEDETKDFEQSGWCQMKSCVFWQFGFLSPISKNSVLEELGVRTLAVIEEEICRRAF